VLGKFSWRSVPRLAGWQFLPLLTAGGPAGADIFGRTGTPRFISSWNYKNFILVRELLNKKKGFTRV
jgi:hypothetical protein